MSKQLERMGAEALLAKSKEQTERTEKEKKEKEEEEEEERSSSSGSGLVRNSFFGALLGTLF